MGWILLGQEEGRVICSCQGQALLHWPIQEPGELTVTPLLPQGQEVPHSFLPRPLTPSKEADTEQRG